MFLRMNIEKSLQTALYLDISSPAALILPETTMTIDVNVLVNPAVGSGEFAVD